MTLDAYLFIDSIYVVYLWMIQLSLCRAFFLSSKARETYTLWPRGLYLEGSGSTSTNRVR